MSRLLFRDPLMAMPGLLKPLLPSASLLLLVVGNGSVARAMDTSMVMRLCMAGFEAAMQASAKTPPAGMGSFTCTCFVDRVQAGSSITDAQNHCREQAAARYKLSP